MSGGCGPVRVLSPEEIEAIREEIVPIEKIPLWRWLPRVRLEDNGVRPGNYYPGYRQRRFEV